MPTVTILRGVSGSGKSTIANMLTQLGAVVVSADKYFIQPFGGYVFDPAKLKQAHEYCYDMLRMELLSGNDVIVDNTNTTEKEIAKYLEFAQERGYKVTCLVVENRHGSDSIHDVPEEVRKKQAMRLAQSIKLI